MLLFAVREGRERVDYVDVGGAHYTKGSSDGVYVAADSKGQGEVR